jgi:Protein of unknown function (DUF3307)
MEAATVAIAMLVWLQVKHYVADYLLQPVWMLEAKDDPRRVGGYAHAGLHAFGSLPAFLIAGLGIEAAAVLALAEFAAHYVIDFGKARLSVDIAGGPDTKIYWSLHGGDQLMHHLTYSGLIIAAITLTPAAVR